MIGKAQVTWHVGGTEPLHDRVEKRTAALFHAEHEDGLVFTGWVRRKVGRNRRPPSSSSSADRAEFFTFNRSVAPLSTRSGE